MNIVIIGIGLPGSGKSVALQSLQEQHPEYALQLVRPDSIRHRLNSEDEHAPHALVRDHTRQVIAALLARGQNVMMDATNSNPDQRRELIRWCRECGADRIIGIWVRRPLAACLADNERRSEPVPEEVMLRMANELFSYPPSLVDGFDELVEWAD